MLSSILANIEWEWVLRVVAAFVAGAIVGTERESHGRAAGMRTTVLVCVAACLAMLLSSALLRDQVAASGNPSLSTFRADPARLAAGVLTGMGFLGAGAILRNGNRVQGLTTAATLWFVSMIGLAFGGGYFDIGLLGVLMLLCVLFVLPPIERLVKNDWYATVTVRVHMDGASDSDVLGAIEAHDVRVKDVEMDYDALNQCRTLRYELKFKKDQAIGLSSRIVTGLQALSGIQLVSWS